MFSLLNFPQNLSQLDELEETNEEYTVGQWLKFIQDVTHKNDRDLAAELKVSASDFSRLKKSRQLPTADFLIRFRTSLFC